MPQILQPNYLSPVPKHYVMKSYRSLNYTFTHSYKDYDFVYTTTTCF